MVDLLVSPGTVYPGVVELAACGYILRWFHSIWEVWLQ